MRVLLSVLFLSIGLMSATLDIMTEEYPPSNYEYEGKVKGICTEVVREIQKKVKDDSPIQMTSWVRGYKTVQKQPNTAIFCTVRLENREKMFYWVGPLAYDRNVLYEHRDAPTGIKTLDDARGVSSISTGSTSNADWIILNSQGFDNLITTDKVTQSDSIMPLVGKRTILATGKPFTTLVHLKRKGIDPAVLVDTGVLVYEKPLYLAFNKQTDENIVKKWQAALDEMVKSGEYDAIQEKAIREAYEDFGLKLELSHMSSISESR